jgi:uncharacterized membrane protein YkvA (DUF1232 family)
MSREQFTEWVGEAILSLPQDMKAVLRIVEDPEVDDQGRVMAAGSLLHVLSASNSIPGARGILGFVDDVLVLRLVLERIEQTNPDAIARHREESPELFDGGLELARSYLGDLIKVLEKAAENVSKLSHQGHSAKECVHDLEVCNWLYDAVQEAMVDQLEFDEDEVMRETKRVDQLLPHLRNRAATLK